jgi:hypothetical protein
VFGAGLHVAARKKTAEDERGTLKGDALQVDAHGGAQLGTFRKRLLQQTEHWRERGWV